MDVSLMRKEEPPHGRDQIVETLFGLFSRAGFDGVALSDISEATGLGKSSLYHHFPGGKDDMAAAVVSFASAWLAEHVFAPLKSGKTLSSRLDGMLKGVNELYDGGAKPCLIATMLVGHREDSLGRSLSRIFIQWVDAIAEALVEAGAAPKEARDRAAAAIVRIEGALILGRALGDKLLFARTLKEVKTMLGERL
jgi:TetR/AcrR family transcriptional regulator, lmrAB and yxaGH operons repressor